MVTPFNHDLIEVKLPKSEVELIAIMVKEKSFLASSVTKKDFKNNLP